MVVNEVPINETYGLNFEGIFLLDVECVNSSGQKVYPYLLRKQNGPGEWVFDVSLSGKSSEYRGLSLQSLLEAFRDGAFQRGAQLRMKPKSGGGGNGFAPLKGKISEYMMELFSKGALKQFLTISEAVNYLKNRFELVYEDAGPESFFVVFKSGNGKVVAARKSYFTSTSGARGYEQVRSGVLLWTNSFVPRNKDIIEYVDTVFKSPEGLVIGAPELRYSAGAGFVVRQVISLEGLEFFCTSVESGEEVMGVRCTENSNIESLIPLNSILYGPPGTGKTYSVVLKSMSIVDRADYGLQVSADKYHELKKRYDKLVADGQISFVTFHQSYGYEDFIEGIRPRTEGQQISYDVRDGVLKSIALRARENWMRATRQGHVALDDADLFERVWQLLLDSMDESPEGKVKIKLLRGFEGEVEQGPSGRNVIVSLPGYTTVYSLPKKQLRKIWGRRHEISKPSDTKLYNASFFWAVLECLKSLAGKIEPESIPTEELKPFVIVIDEINRGNISKIFGELITLVEEDKRLGEPYEMTVTLPYSQDDEEPFGLPPNLFLLGTMNTSDRSIALLDTALRRRFEFEELQPNPDVLRGVEIDADIDLAAMLRAINERVEFLYDRDHTIGHAYFMGVKSLADLDRVFRRKVIPLLQEYFYEDWAKVVLVLNDQDGRFIVKKDDIPEGLKGPDVGFDVKPRYTVRQEPFAVEAYRGLYS